MYGFEVGVDFWVGGRGATQVEMSWSNFVSTSMTFF